MEQVLFFDTIIIDPPRDRIYRRLGYRRGITLVSEAEWKRVEEVIEQARSLIHLQGASRRCPVSSRNDRGLVLADGTVLESRRLARLLRSSPEMVLMGATAGGTIVEAISSETEQGNLSGAVVLDAAASEMADAALDWMSRNWNARLRREGRRLLARRFSAGYGDFALENQRSLFRLLELHRLGVAINREALLSPEKSVTAITGILSDSETGPGADNQQGERERDSIGPNNT